MRGCIIRYFPTASMQDLELAIFEVVADTPFGRPAAFIGQMCLFMTDHIDQLDACLRKQFYPVCKKVRVRPVSQQLREPLAGPPYAPDRSRVLG